MSNFNLRLDSIKLIQGIRKKNLFISTLLPSVIHIQKNFLKKKLFEIVRFIPK